MFERKHAAAGLSVLEAAKIAGVGRSTIYEELATGRLKAKKLRPAHHRPRACARGMDVQPAKLTGLSAVNRKR